MITFVLALASRASRGALPPLVLALISRASRGALPPLVLALIGRPVRALRTSYGDMEISCGCPKSTLIRKHLVAFVKERKNDADAGWTVCRSLGPPETC